MIFTLPVLAYLPEIMGANKRLGFFWSGVSSCGEPTVIKAIFSSVQFSSVAQSCPTLCDPMKCSTAGLPVHHQLPEFTQTHVHRVSDAIQPSHPLSSPSPQLAMDLFLRTPITPPDKRRASKKKIQTTLYHYRLWTCRKKSGDSVPLVDICSTMTLTH